MPLPSESAPEVVPAPAGKRAASPRRPRAVEGESRRWGRIALAAVVAALLVNVVAGDRGYLQFRQMEQRRVEALAQLEQKRAQNEALRRRIRQLKSDPVAIEHEIRSQLGYARPGEVVFSVREAPAPNPQAPSSAAISGPRD